MARDPLGDVNARGVPTVAAALGLQPRTARTYAPCPACGAERRGSADPRGPIGVRADLAGWVCHRCQAKGDPVALAAYLVLGHVPTDKAEWRRVIAACADQGLCEAGQAAPDSAPRPYVPPPPPPSPAPPRRPPAEEVADLWARCLPVTAAPDVAAYLKGRGYDLDVIEALDLARALPPERRRTAWCVTRAGTWWESGHRLVFPLVDATGAVQSLQARHLGDGKPKYVSPTGYEVRELVAANGPGRRILAGLPHMGRVIVAEGMTDFLTASALEARRFPARRSYLRQLEQLRGRLAVNDDTPATPGACFLCRASLPGAETCCARCAEAAGVATDPTDAVFSVLAGAWCAAIAARIPDRAEVVIATDADAAGDRYAQVVAGTLRDRCVLKRWTPRQDPRRRTTGTEWSMVDPDSLYGLDVTTS